MALQSHAPYLACIRETLKAALCLQNFPSQVAERHNKPEVEARSSPEVLLNPITIAKDENERVLIEPSINSVRVSIKMKQSDDVERLLTARYVAFLAERAEKFIILRRKPVQGFDVSFLITNDHTETMLKQQLVAYIISFLQDIDKEIKDQKIGLNSRARLVAREFLGSF
eukprot:RCo043950